MANYIKSFNFRNGVQVDNDNFIVNAVGRVGIGTTVPEKLLDVRGNAKVVGHITATDASVSGIVTVGSITINGSTGTISASTFSGSAGNFGDQPVVAITTGGFVFANLGLTTTFNLGIGTDSVTEFELQVGGDPTVSGFGVTSGNVTASGNLKVSGISTLGVTTVTDLTGQQLSVSGVSTLGVTTTTDLTVQQLNVSGVSTLGVTTTTDLTVQQLNVSGISTFNDDIIIGTGATVGFGSTAYFKDNAAAFFGNGEDLKIYHDGSNSYIDDAGTGNLILNGNHVVIQSNNNTEIIAEFSSNGSVELYYDNSKKFETTNDGVLVSGGTTTGSLRVSGVSTLSGDIFIGVGASVGFGTTAYFRDHAKAIFGDSNDLQIYHDEANSYISDQGIGDLRLSGNVVKLNNQANTATMVKATQGDSVELNYNNSKKFETSNTGVTVTGSIGIGTSAPSADLQIRKASGNATLEVISDTAKASISIGNSVGAGTSSALINYGSTSGFGNFSTSQSFDIINRDIGYINYFLSSNASNDSSFVWHKGSTNQLMTLTNDGKLGIGITNPEHLLSVQGISTFTGNAHFDGNVTIDGSVTIDSITASVTGDVSGNLSGNVNTTTGISTFKEVKITSRIGIGTISSTDKISVNDIGANRFMVDDAGKVGVKTDSVNTDMELDVNGDIQARHGLVVGVTTEPKCAIDMSSVVDVFADGTSRATIAYMIPPRVTTAQRNALTDIGGNALGTDEAGATVYNITTNKLQVWNGSTWNDCF